MPKLQAEMLETKAYDSLLEHNEQQQKSSTGGGIFSLLHLKFTQLSTFHQNQFVGCAIVFLSVVLGCATKRNGDLPLVSGYVSNIIGYIFLLAWSISFYPQLLLNWERKTTIGYSPEFVHLNLSGYVVYSLYNVLFFFDEELQQAYRDKNGGQNNLVEIHDVLFALHGLLLTLLTMCQCYYYDGRKQCPSYLTIFVCFVVITAPTIWYASVAPALPLDLVYFMSYEKMFITLVKYAPQAVYNARRKSTIGWSIGNILLDLTGGVLSLAQLLLDGVATGDFSNILGNPVKLGLGLITIVYDTIFCLQHYVWYPSQHGDASKTEDSQGLPVHENED
jgi:cystinosin